MNLKYGIDNIDKYLYLFKNKRAGLLTSNNALNKEYISSIDILKEKINIAKLFGAEHGVRGDRSAGEYIDSYIDSQTGLTVYSLYRKDGKRFTAEMLEDIDIVVYDIADIGVRYYTFISTLHNAIIDCAKYGKQLVILDRPNPLGCNMIDGNVLNIDYKSFVGTYSIPIRHSLTVGEFALLINTEEKINCDIKIVTCTGLGKKTIFTDTDRMWIMPSPNIPTFDTALAYVGTCLFEGTNISEGRGTTAPFQIIGADFIDGEKLTKELNNKDLKGVIFTPTYFKPTASKFQNLLCGGAHIHITNYSEYESFKVGLNILETIKNMYPQEYKILPPPKENKKPFISLLIGNSDLENNDWTSESLLNKYNNELNQFSKIRDKYRLYI